MLSNLRAVLRRVSCRLRGHEWTRRPLAPPPTRATYRCENCRAYRHTRAVTDDYLGTARSPRSTRDQSGAATDGGTLNDDAEDSDRDAGGTRG